MTSQARIDANRLNARKSTGPRTAEGKARSRLNGLTHGLRSDEVVLPTEDPAAFGAHLDAWMADWKPPTMARHQLVERLAVNAWRLRRCVRIEGRVLSRRVDDALNRWDRREEAAVDRLVEQLATDPAAAVEGLEANPAGVLRLIDLWDEVATAAEEPDGWFDVDGHHHRSINLMGFLADDAEVADQVSASWRLLLRARPDLLDEDDDDRPLDDARAEVVRGQVASTALIYVGELRKLLAGLPDDSAARAATAEVAAFAVHPEDAPLRRYEGQLDREFRAGLNQLIKLSESGADLLADADAPTEAELPGRPVVAPTPEAPTEPNPDDAEAPAEAEAPTEPNAIVSILTLASADGDRKGRGRPFDGADLPRTGTSDR